MAYRNEDVVAVVTGSWSVAGSEAVVPTSGTDALTGWIDLGYISEDGTTETHSKDTTDIKAHQRAAVVKTVVTEATSEFDVTFIETNVNVMQLYFGVADASGVIEVKPSQMGEYLSFVHQEIEEYADGGVSTIRNYIPKGQVIETQPLEYKNGQAVNYGLKIRAYPDEDGVTVVKWATTVS